MLQEGLSEKRFFVSCFMLNVTCSDLTNFVIDNILEDEGRLAPFLRKLNI